MCNNHLFEALKAVSRPPLLPVFLLLLLFPFTDIFAEPSKPETRDIAEIHLTPASSAASDTLTTLLNFTKVRDELLADIQKLNKKLDATKSDSEKNTLKLEIDKLQGDLRTTMRNINNIAAQADLSLLETEQEKEFNLQEEFFALLKPALEEIKDMTSHVRKKSKLREKITYYEERMPVIEEALANIRDLKEKNTDTSLAAILEITEKSWHTKHSFMQSELQATKLQLGELEAEETSISEASQSYIKSFFQKRGLYISQALLTVIVILFLSRISYNLMQRYLPGFRKKHRTFQTRLLELLHRIFTFLLVIIGPMVVFYLAEDWVLFSLGILLLIGIALALRHTLPLYWHQGQLFLNIGSVREGERILMDGLPWEVERINFFCVLSNPVANLSQRVPIGDMVEMKSRPVKDNEPWFPCQREDWVILSDGVRGKVIGISLEMVQLVERGGTLKTYQTSDFLALSPQNLSTNFRIKEFFGMTYSLQEIITTRVPQILELYIKKRIEEEGYAEKLLNLRVEFAKANSSSLDIAIIADFKGELGDLYNRLRRAIQRWCVDACSENNWEIPFPQLTIHGQHATDNVRKTDDK